MAKTDKLKTSFIILLLSITSLANAQQSDLGIAVKKKKVLTISPDSMYFDSHTSRKFKIFGIPEGAIVTGQFNGSNIHVAGNQVTLQPFFVYRDSDIIKYKNGQARMGYKTTAGDFYITSLSLKITDGSGQLIDSLSRTCYIRPESYNPPKRFPLSSATFDPLMKPLIKSAGLDSGSSGEKRKISK